MKDKIALLEIEVETLQGRLEGADKDYEKLNLSYAQLNFQLEAVMEKVARDFPVTGRVLALEVDG